MKKHILSLMILFLSTISLSSFAMENKKQCYGSLSQINGAQSTLIKNLYNEAILNEGATLNKFYNNFTTTNSPLSNEDQTNIRLMYIGLVRDGIICKKLKMNKHYDLKNIALDIKALIPTG